MIIIIIIIIKRSTVQKRHNNGLSNVYYHTVTRYQTTITLTSVWGQSRIGSVYSSYDLFTVGPPAGLAKFARQITFTKRYYSLEGLGVLIPQHFPDDDP